MYCENCGIEFESTKSNARFCSPNCRVTHHRKGSVVTADVTLSAPIVTAEFRFVTKYVPIHASQDSLVTKHAKPRTAKYWYDVPLGAIPIYEKGWPKMPKYMNGRQYFLWWKNEFAVTPNETPVLLNVFPALDNVRYEMGGAGSRKWGA